MPRCKSVSAEGVLTTRINFWIIAVELTKKHDILTVEGIKRNLSTSFIGTDIYILDAIDSTNNYAHKLAKEGARHGTIVLAEAQTKGKGRLGRSWFSPSGANIYLSVILRPQMHPAHITLLTFAAAIAVAKAIRDAANLNANIKWPNDILMKDKKTAGILSEMDARKDKVRFAIIGIGINANLDAEDIPFELKDKATSIKIESNSTIKRMDLICTVLNNLEEWYNIFERNGADDIIREWKSLAVTLNRDVKVQSGNSFVEGRAVDIDENGALLIMDRGGIIQRVLSGDVMQ